MYVPLAKTILDADLSNDVESHVYDAQDPNTAPQDGDSPQKLGHKEQQTAQTLRNAGQAQVEDDFPAKDFKEQVGEHYPASCESCKLSEEFLASAESHVFDSQDRKTALQHGDSSRNVGDKDQQTAQTLHNAGKAQEEGDILAEEIKEHVGEHYSLVWRVV